MDLKDGHYADKDAFIEVLSRLMPSLVIDSGRGVHAYWEVSDLTAMSYLRLQRRLCRAFNTDPAVSQICQLMRAPGYDNVKEKGNPVPCEILYEGDRVYTCEELDKALPGVTQADEQHCQQHYEKTYNPEAATRVDERLPARFDRLVKDNAEVRDIWTGNVDDRSKGDYRLAHIMWASGFSKEEAMSVLVNCAKALERAPIHRVGYAEGIVSKIWTGGEVADNGLTLSSSVRDILQRSGDTLKGTRFPCWSYIDDTAHGFRLGQVLGLVAGSGVGKTAVALNLFEGFVKNNPDYQHFFIPLEQPAEEIADRWRSLCGENTALYDKVHVLSNYDQDGNFRHLSLQDIQDYLVKFQAVTGQKIGCVVIDHIGALKKDVRNGEGQGIIDICHKMKALAVQTNTLVVMQSQTSREKAGIGDLELNKDAAFGSVMFEAYTDYLITLHQPLKRCYSEPACPTVTAFKFCKIRHKKSGVDRIQEDVCYRLFFNPETGRLRPLTQAEETSFDFFNAKATNKRKEDRKTDIVSYTSASWGNKGA